MRIERKAVFDPSELRKELAKLREEHKTILRHAKRLEEYYSDHEDRIAALDMMIYQEEQNHGLTREQVIAKVEDDALADLLPEA